MPVHHPASATDNTQPPMRQRLQPKAQSLPPSPPPPPHSHGDHASLVVRVLGRWLRRHLPGAQRSIAKCVFARSTLSTGDHHSVRRGGHGESSSHRDAVAIVCVEAAGSGRVLVPGVEVSPSVSQQQLKEIVCTKVGIQPLACQLAMGHGGREVGSRPVYVSSLRRCG